MAEKRSVEADQTFGLLVLLILLLPSAWHAYRGGDLSGQKSMVLAAFVTGLLAFFRPSSFRWGRLIWMGFGRFMSRITSPVLLTVIWILFLTPLGLWRRLRGGDDLKREWKSEEDESAWVVRSRAPRASSSYRMQF